LHQETSLNRSKSGLNLQITAIAIIMLNVRLIIIKVAL
jgi:hypothetical protein